MRQHRAALPDSGPESNAALRCLGSNDPYIRTAKARCMLALPWTSPASLPSS